MTEYGAIDLDKIYSERKYFLKNSIKIEPDDEEQEYLPKDRYKLVYFIILLHGIGTLIPWNMFISIAPQYFIDFKLQPANSSKPEYAVNFFSYLGVCSQFPNLVVNFLNLFIVVKDGLAPRIVLALFVLLASCMVTLIFVFIDTSYYTFGYFLITMLSVIILNSANGIYQNSMFGIIADFPPQYINASIMGMNFCGIFIAVLLIITTLGANDVQWSAFYYFLIALLVVVFCIVSFFILQKLRFYRYYTKKAQRLREIEEDKQHEQISWKIYLALLKEDWLHFFNIFLVFFVTLAIFPAVVSETPLYPGRADFFIPNDLYVIIAVFLNFNVFATIGNFIANYIQWPSPKYLWTLTFPRLLFIPIFLYCNFGGDLRNTNFPVFIQNEWNFIILLSLLSISHGYLSSLAMMYAPKAVHPSKAQAAGMMSGVVLLLGIFLGNVFTLIESHMFKVI
uniref:Equilibrative nucleoside transporter 1 n=1 Tax=Acrobeloides nanus TaxID=290746 RepID=A0A914E694_9BILA